MDCVGPQNGIHFQPESSPLHFNHWISKRTADIHLPSNKNPGNPTLLLSSDSPDSRAPLVRFASRGPPLPSCRLRLSASPPVAGSSGSGSRRARPPRALTLAGCYNLLSVAFRAKIRRTTGRPTMVGSQVPERAWRCLGEEMPFPNTHPLDQDPLIF